MSPPPSRHPGLDAACFGPAAVVTLAVLAVALHRAPWALVAGVCAVPLVATSISMGLERYRPLAVWRVEAAVSVTVFLLVSRAMPLLPQRWSAHQATVLVIVILLPLIAVARYPEAHARDRRRREAPQAVTAPAPAPKIPQPVPESRGGPPLDLHESLTRSFEEITGNLADVEEASGEFAATRAQELVLRYLQKTTAQGQTVNVTGTLELLRLHKIAVDPTTIRRWFRRWEGQGLAECVHSGQWRSRPPSAGAA